MTKHAKRIIELLEENDGLDDDEISERLQITPRQTVNIVCRKLEQDGVIKRFKSQTGGRIRNYYKMSASHATIIATSDSNVTQQEHQIPYISTLEEVGFVYAGYWEMSDDYILASLNDTCDAVDALYAFTVDTEVKYVGKTSRQLKQRLNMYRKPGKTQATNIRNNASIKAILEQGGTVEIYAMSNNSKSYKGFKLSLPAALEDSIITTLKPEWNVRK